MQANQLTFTTASSRILLRIPMKQDIDMIYKHVKDPSVLRYTFIPYPYTRKHAETFVRNAPKQARDMSALLFIIIEKETDALIGSVGLMRFSADKKTAEVGYWIAKPFRGNGYATEATVLTLQFGFTKAKLERIYAHVMAPNTQSHRVLKKSGLRKEGIMRRHVKRMGRWHDMYMYGMTKPDWKRLKRK